LPVGASDAALVAALRGGRLDARGALVDRYADELERLLFRVLGPDSEIPDLLQEVCVSALTSLDTLREPAALRAWLRGIAIRMARKHIRKRTRWRFIRLLQPSELPEREAPELPLEVSEALRCTYAVLDRMNPEQRLLFALRYVDQMELSAVAEATGVSLATVKRRLTRARRSFVELASEHEALHEWLDVRSEPPGCAPEDAP
jgi:RNA polymerase sigma-70 factor (ECF subfamily)